MASGDVSSIVDILVTSLERNFTDFNISEIVKGGSLGHGTGVAGSSDLDLVIYSRSFTGQNVLDEGGSMFKKWLDKLDRFLQGHFHRNYQKTNMTKHSVQFRFQNTIDVDLLVSPYYESAHDFYTFLKTIDRSERDRFSVSASKWQVQFFKKQPPQVKEYIRSAKQWRNDKWPESESGSGRPSSYFLSLLVVAAYEQNPYNVAEGLKQLVRSVHNLDLSWPGHCYKMSDFPTLLPSRPRIVDPANPANNVLITGLKNYNTHRPSDYEPGEGNTSSIQREIHSVSDYM